MGAVLSGFLAASCSYVMVGHKIDPDVVEKVNPGVTTEQEIMELFGKPAAVSFNKTEGITTYTFKNLRNTSLILPIPFLALGKSADKGYMLNVYVKEGLVLNYDLIRFRGSYFPWF